MVDFVAGDTIVHVQENAIDHVAPLQDDGDILVAGWLTTVKKNAYNQIVHTSAFEHPEAFNRWNGRMLLEHGRRFLIGGGDPIPIGQFTSHRVVADEGLRGSGHIYRENDVRLKRAVRDKTLNAWSIGFQVVAKGKDRGWSREKKTGTVHLTRLSIFETSLCDVGANDESLVELIHSLQERGYGSTDPNKELINRYDNRGYFYLVSDGKTYLVNPEGDITDGRQN